MVMQAAEHFESAKVILEEVRDEEQDAMDNMPENLQESDRYLMMEETVDVLEEAIEDVDELLESISGLTE